MDRLKIMSNKSSQTTEASADTSTQRSKKNTPAKRPLFRHDLTISTLNRRGSPTEASTSGLCVRRKMKIHDGNDDFEASIQILSPEEGGRTTKPHNGIRWDFCYSEDDPKNGLYMIHPDFFGKNGDSLEGTLPFCEKLDARMRIIVEEMKEKIHRKRIKVGTEFYCHEGSRRVAKGKVSKLTGLNKERKHV